jgi:hypothetical protein
LSHVDKSSTGTRGREWDQPRFSALPAKQDRCFFEINSSPDRLDLSAENCYLAAVAGIKIGVSTDAHGTREFRADPVRYRLGAAGRLDKVFILNCLSWQKLGELIGRKQIGTNPGDKYASKHRGPHIKAACPAGVWRSFLSYLGRAILFETPDRECVLALL